MDSKIILVLEFHSGIWHKDFIPYYLPLVLSKIFSEDLEKEIAKSGGMIVPWEVTIL
ncbi:hypothetical protein M422DRAFT_34352 [Sphaerobolus stellatus SS14]|uniref:Uncharacterized protein n=1 Tax=Sphaerobolus stellatus (strain SS14) TaxID=990650 RepID=A0A0C9V391_SPHS4|nr:hypothetical protein M422DRAFT_34352 [Sphaerobolus stellatus SS14]